MLQTLLNLFRSFLVFLKKFSIIESDHKNNIETMSDIILIRKREQQSVDSEGDKGLRQTLGELHVMDGEDSIWSCKTLELPWRRNLRNISCIPPEPGKSVTYKWKMTNSTPAFPYAHLFILDVKDRTHISVHAGNFVINDGTEKGDSRGCPLVGKTFAYIDDDNFLDITHSRDTMREMCRQLKDELGLTEGTITIISQVGVHDEDLDPADLL